MSNTNNAWKEAFAAEIQKLDADMQNSVMHRYDSIADSLGAETAYLTAMAEITNQSLQTIQGKAKTIKQQIFETLEKANREHQGINVHDKIARVRAAAKKWNSTMEAVTKNVQVRVGNCILKINESEYDLAKYNMPATMKQQSYEALASTDKKGVKGELACRITTFNGR